MVECISLFNCIKGRILSVDFGFGRFWKVLCQKSAEDHTLKYRYPFMKNDNFNMTSLTVLNEEIAPEE